MEQLFSLVEKGGSVYKKHAGFCLETQIHLYRYTDRQTEGQIDRQID